MGKINSKPCYDVVVIGAGMGGLTAAAVLSKAGYSVAVLESAANAGGYLAGFHRKRFRFDTAIHWLNQCNPGGIIHTVFETIGSDYPKAAVQRRIKRYRGDAHDYLLTNNPDELKARLIEDFPHERKGIERFFKHAWQLGRQMSGWGKNVRAGETYSGLEKLSYVFNTFRFILPFIRHIRFTGPNGVAKGLSQYFRDKRLHALFSTEPDLLSCLVPIGWAYFSDFQNPPVGGGQVFPEWLKYVIEQLKNDVFFNCRVTKILLEGNTVGGVEFNHRGIVQTIASRYVVAACDVETLYEKMLPEQAVPAQLKNRLKSAALYGSSFTISIALDCPAEQLGFGEEALHISKQTVKYSEQTAANPHTTELIILAPSARDSSLAPAGQGILTIFMPAEMHQHNYWNTIIDSEGNYLRQDAYKKLKDELAAAILKRIEEELVPGLRQHILFYEVATPVTHYRYTGNRNGTMMGARPGKENMKAGIAHYRTPVNNLLLGSHWAELGGGVPIAVKAGYNAALLIFKDEQPEIFKVHRDYISAKVSPEQMRNSPVFKSYSSNWEKRPTPAQMLAARRRPEISEVE